MTIAKDWDRAMQCLDFKEDWWHASLAQRIQWCKDMKVSVFAARSPGPPSYVAWGKYLYKRRR